MNEQPSSNSQLTHALDRVATYRKDPTTLLPYARSMIALADEIERLSQDLAREVGTRSARVAEIDSLRQRVAELAGECANWKQLHDANEACIADLHRQLREAKESRAAHEPPAGLWGDGTREMLIELRDWLRSKMPCPAGDCCNELRNWIEKVDQRITHHAPAATQPPPESHSADNLERFTDWLVKEMPAGTVIGDPAWWARKLLAAACVFADEAPEDPIDFIAAEYLHVLPFDIPTGAGDADVGWRVLQSHQGKGDVEVAAVYRDDLPEAIAAARVALTKEAPPQLCGHDDGSHCDETCAEKVRKFRAHYGLPPKGEATETFDAQSIPDGWCPICGGKDGDHKSGCQDGSEIL